MNLPLELILFIAETDRETWIKMLALPCVGRASLKKEQQKRIKRKFVFIRRRGNEIQNIVNGSINSIGDNYAIIKTTRDGISYLWVKDNCYFREKGPNRINVYKYTSFIIWFRNGQNLKEKDKPVEVIVVSKG